MARSAPAMLRPQTFMPGAVGQFWATAIPPGAQLGGRCRQQTRVTSAGHPSRGEARDPVAGCRVRRSSRRPAARRAHAHPCVWCGAGHLRVCRQLGEQQRIGHIRGRLSGHGAVVGDQDALIDLRAFPRPRPPPVLGWSLAAVAAGGRPPSSRSTRCRPGSSPRPTPARGTSVWNVEDQVLGEVTEAFDDLLAHRLVDVAVQHELAGGLPRS